MSRQVKFGDPLNLAIQMGDRDSNVASIRVFCEVRGPTGAILISNFELPHLAGGLYIENTQVMPGVDKVTALFYINKVDGTTPSNKYDPNVYMEEIVRDITGEIVEENLDKKISDVAISTVEIIGDIVSDSIISAQMPDDDELQGSLESDLIIEGEILDEC